MLKLRRALPEYIEIELAPRRVVKDADGKERVFSERAVARVRPAIAIDVDRATGFVQRMMGSAAALGDDGFKLLALALAADADAIELTDELKTEGSYRLSLAKLATLCTESWSGVCDQDGEPLPVTLENVLLLHMDAGIRARFSAVINAGIHEESAEKNALAASPNGAAAMDGATARAAATTASPAPADCAAATAPSARRPNTLQ
jgi:hypothetical protein